MKNMRKSLLQAGVAVALLLNPTSLKADFSTQLDALRGPQPQVQYQNSQQELEANPQDLEKFRAWSQENEVLQHATDAVRYNKGAKEHGEATKILQEESNEREQKLVGDVEKGRRSLKRMGNHVVEGADSINKAQAGLQLPQECSTTINPQQIRQGVDQFAAEFENRKQGANEALKDVEEDMQDRSAGLDKMLNGLMKEAEEKKDQPKAVIALMNGLIEGINDPAKRAEKFKEFADKAWDKLQAARMTFVKSLIEFKKKNEELDGQKEALADAGQEMKKSVAPLKKLANSIAGQYQAAAAVCQKKSGKLPQMVAAYIRGSQLKLAANVYSPAMAARVQEKIQKLQEDMNSINCTDTSGNVTGALSQSVTQLETNLGNTESLSMLEQNATNGMIAVDGRLADVGADMASAQSPFYGCKLAVSLRKSLKGGDEQESIAIGSDQGTPDQVIIQRLQQEQLAMGQQNGASGQGQPIPALNPLVSTNPAPINPSGASTYAPVR